MIDTVKQSELACLFVVFPIRAPCPALSNIHMHDFTSLGRTDSIIPLTSDVYD